MFSKYNNLWSTNNLQIVFSDTPVGRENDRLK
jgi:hypothetical protein